MFKTLLKKEYFECFRSYFVNAKTGKARKKGATIAFFILFSQLMLLIGALFFGMAFLLGDSLIQYGLSWLYFALMGMMAIALGTFGSVFNTYATLYMAKDNEMLLAMPIPPSYILLSRISLVFGMSLLYSGLVWMPACIYYWIMGTPTVAAVICELVIGLLIALFVSVLTCALGWVVALIASRIKNKSFISVILTVGFLGIYYGLSFNMSNLIEQLMANRAVVGNGIQKWANFFYQMGMGAIGEVVPMVIFGAIVLVLSAICFYVMAKSFIRIVTRTTGTSKAAFKQNSVHATGKKKTLYKRELKRFTSSPTYMLNSGLGIILLLVFAVFIVIKKNMVIAIINEFTQLIPGIGDFPPLLVLVIICFILATNAITTPSVSLEGKTLWIIRSLPVQGWDVLSAKLKLHVSLNIGSALVAVLLSAYSFNMDVVITVIITLYVLLFICFTGAAGLIIGVKRPNFNWTSEAVPIKQSLNLVFSMLIGIAVPILTAVGFYFLRNMMDISLYLGICTAVLAGLSAVLIWWLKTRGAVVFDSL